MRITLSLAVTLAIILLTLPNTTNTSAASPFVELAWDDGTAEGWEYQPTNGLAVRFTNSQTVEISRAKILLKLVSQQPSAILVHIWDANRRHIYAERVEDFRLDCGSSGKKENPGWLCVDFTRLDIVVGGDFYLGVSWPELESPPLLGGDLNSSTGYGFLVDLSANNFVQITNATHMIHAIVRPLYTTAVDVTGSWGGNWQTYTPDPRWNFPLQGTVSASLTSQSYTLKGNTVTSISVGGTATLTVVGGPIPPIPPRNGIVSGTVSGYQITFTFTDGSVVYQFDGTLSDPEGDGITSYMSGTFTCMTVCWNPELPGTWQMTRQ